MIKNKNLMSNKRERRNKTQLIKYRISINFCMMKDCMNTVPLETHHIIPFNDGGTDSFDNYICLCRKCHRQIHRDMWKFSNSKIIELQDMLYKNKINYEIELLGESSLNICNTEFRRLLNKRIKLLNELIMKSEKVQPDKPVKEFKGKNTHKRKKSIKSREVK